MTEVRVEKDEDNAVGQGSEMRHGESPSDRYR